MIAHIAPTNRNRDESRNTLEYADRAKNISNKVSNILLICTLAQKYAINKKKSIWNLTYMWNSWVMTKFQT